MLNSPLVLHFSFNDAAAMIDTNLFNVPLGCEYEITEVMESHTVLGTDGAAVTLDLKRSTGVQTPAQGTSLLTSLFDMKAAINTVVRKVRGAGLVGGLGAISLRTIRPGDRLTLDMTGTPTSVAGVALTIVLVQTRRQGSSRGK